MSYRVDPKNKKCLQVNKDGKWQRKGCTEGSFSTLHASVKDVNESEEFEWAEDVMSELPLEFVGKEIMVDVSDLNQEEKVKLLSILQPYVFRGIPLAHGDWGLDCLIKKKNIKSISLHCGTEDNEYKPLKGRVCCLSYVFGDQEETIPEDIVPIKGRYLLEMEDKSKQSSLLENEDSEFGWAEELLKLEDGVDVTIPPHSNFEDVADNIKFLESLPVGSILNITGYQDGLEIEGVKAEIVREHIGGNIYSQYLFKFPEVYYNDNGEEPTHCGARNEDKNICECQEEDDAPNGEVGKCWWVDLKNMDKVIYYPNKIKENKKEKPLLIEGRYDAITRRAVKDIMKSITKSDSDTYILPLDTSDEDEYVQEGMAFSVELDLDWSGHDEEGDLVKVFKVVSEVLKTEENEESFDDEEENVIAIKIYFGSEFTKKNLEELFYKLQEDVRHEIEHLTQEGPYRIEDRPVYKGSTAKLKTVLGHHKNVIEVPALVHGFYRRAKLEKKPLDQVMREDLDSEIERGNLTKKSAEKLFNMWVDYAKKNLPHAKYKSHTYLP